MTSKTYSCFVAITMLMMVVKPASFKAIDDFELPEEGKRSEAQMYYDQIPDESKFWK